MVFFPFKLQLEKGCKESAALGGQATSTVRSVVFAATLGRCHLAAAEAALELVHTLSLGPVRSPTARATALGKQEELRLVQTLQTGISNS